MPPTLGGKSLVTRSAVVTGGPRPASGAPGLAGAHPARGVEAQVGDQPGPLEHPNGPRLVGVDDDRVTGLAIEQEGDKAVIAGVGVLKGAVVAVDGDRGCAIVCPPPWLCRLSSCAIRMTDGCDTPTQVPRTNENRTWRCGLSALVSTSTTDCQGPSSDVTVDDREDQRGADEGRKQVVGAVACRPVAVPVAVVTREQALEQVVEVASEPDPSSMRASPAVAWGAKTWQRPSPRLGAERRTDRSGR